MSKNIILIFLILAVTMFLACDPVLGPRLEVSTTTLEFANNPYEEDTFQHSFTIKTVDSTVPIDWSLEAPTWLTLNMYSGTATALEETITVTVNEPIPTEDKADIITISSSKEGIDDVVIDVTFTFTEEKDDVFVVLINSSDGGGGTVFGALYPDGTFNLITTPSGVGYHSMYDIQYDYDFGTETGDVYISGNLYDFSFNDLGSSIFKNGTEFEDVTTPTGGLSEPSMPSFNYMGVMNGDPHYMVNSKVPNTNPGGDNTWHHYWDGSQYATLPSPTSGNQYKIEGVKELDGDIYIFGYEKAGESWIADAVRPIVWKNDGSNTTLIESFELLDNIAGTLSAGDYRSFTVEDINLTDNGEILLSADFDQGNSTDGYTYYVGYFKNDSTFTPVHFPNGETTDSYWVSQIVSEDDFIIEGYGYTEDIIYIGGEETVMEEPSNLHPSKPVDYVRMISDGEDVYSLGYHEPQTDSFIILKTMVWRNAKIVLEMDSADDGSGTVYESFTAEDMYVPKRP